MSPAMSPEEQLYGLMALAQEQQKTAQAALERLATERAALAQERQALAELVTDSYRMSATFGEVAEKTARTALRQAVHENLANLGAITAKSLQEATAPVIARLNGAERMVRRLHTAALVLGAILGVILLAGGALLWRLHDLRVTAATLSTRIQREQATVTELDKRGGRVRWGYCGPHNRLCFEIAPDQGGRTSVPYRGAWQNTQTGTQFVIPRGY